MSQQGQVFPLKTGRGGSCWAYRYRLGGRGARRLQRGGFASQEAAAEALERALEQLRREQGLAEAPTLGELVDAYLAQHDGEPETTEKLRWLLAKSVCAFGERRISKLRSPEIAAWRMTIPPGHRFEATQALRQVLARAVDWGMLDLDPGILYPDIADRSRGFAYLARKADAEKRPFESWDELQALAAALGPRYGPLVVFAAATGLRPGEWLALEQRDIDRDRHVLYVRRAFRNGRVKTPKTQASLRAVPLQTIALAALDQLPSDTDSPLVFPSPSGGHFDLHNFRNRHWRPAQRLAGIEPLRRIYDLRHTFATFALRAGVSTFDLSRYMDTSLAMIDRHYGHLARDGREHAIRLLDTFAAAQPADVHPVDAMWTPKRPSAAKRGNRKSG